MRNYPLQYLRLRPNCEGNPHQLARHARAKFPLASNYSVAYGWVSNPALDRHVHTRPIPRLGGVAIFLTLCCMALLAHWSPGYFGTREFPLSHLTLKILGPATIIFVLGLIDDFYGLSAYMK